MLILWATDLLAKSLVPESRCSSLGRIYHSWVDLHQLPWAHHMASLDLLQLRSPWLSVLFELPFCQSALHRLVGHCRTQLILSSWSQLRSSRSKAMGVRDWSIAIHAVPSCFTVKITEDHRPR